MNRFIIAATLFICSISLYSCQKVIDVDLNEAEPRIVVEAGINNHPGPYYVALSRTVNFDEPNTFPPVTGATVKLSDNAGNSETLTEVQPGIYQTSSITGTPGRTYTLQITASGTTYTAVSTMPQPVMIDKLDVVKGPFTGEPNVHVYFQDPAGVENYYRMVEIINNLPSGVVYLSSDQLRDGYYFEENLFREREDALADDDSVTVLLQTIDKGVHDYFRTLSQATGGGDPGATPGNPLSNFSNGALGYFSAYTEDSKYIIVDKE